MKRRNQTKTAIGVIPARYNARRFPGKLLARLGDRPVIEHVYRKAETARTLDAVWIATDDARIEQAVRDFSGRVARTSSRPRNGTERVAEFCRRRAAQVVVSIQGDEPFIKGEMIDRVVRKLWSEPELVVVTLARKIETPAEFNDPNVVKVVVDRNGFALYFSRSPIPHHRGTRFSAFKHIGLYGYRKDFLTNFVQFPVGELEKREKLEQLRVLENGYNIMVLITKWDTVGIDTPEDLERARQVLENSDRLSGEGDV